MKKSKRSKARIRDNKVDRISNLPDPILHLILSRLRSTEEVVRNSILSKRWKYLWTSVPSINIDFTRKVNEPYTTLFHRNEFKEFVDRVLANRTLDLDSFTLNCPRYEMSTIGQWIDLAVMQKVKLLDLGVRVVLDDDWNDIVVLPRCLVDCDSLEVLKLYLYQCCLSLESFTGSKTLKIFKLDHVELLDHDLVHSFLVNCPLLEELSLINCSICNLDYLDISCPNLKTLRIVNRGLDYHIISGLRKRLKLLCPKLVYLEYGGYMANHCSFDIKSLKKAVIELEDLGQIPILDYNFDVTLRELFAQVSHVEYLSIHCHSIKSIGFLDFQVEVFPSLPNLKTLEITVLDCLMKDFVGLLNCSPNLESLRMIIISVGITPEEVETFVDEFAEVGRRTLTCRHLKRVEFPEFSGEKELLAIARFLLEHGNALEEMVFGWSNKDKYRTQSMDTMNEVSNFYKASLSVKVITLLKDSS